MAIPEKLRKEELRLARKARQDAAAQRSSLPTRGKLLAAKFFVRHRPGR
jgi:hypothetical protein